MTAVIAHRGASMSARENTVAAFRLAVELGADGIELDVRRTADRQLVVHHDARLGDGRAIVELVRSELPEHVPTLRDALAACSGAWVNVEIKNDPADPDFDPGRGLADAVIRVLHDVDPDPQRWLVSSFDRATVGRVRTLDPTLPTALLVEEVPDGVVDQVLAVGHSALHPWVATLEQVHIRQAHEAGLRVNAWTCNDAERMRELVSWGVDGFCTDDPALGRRIVDAAPRPGPA